MANTSHPESMMFVISRGTFSCVLSIVYAPESISPLRGLLGLPAQGSLSQTGSPSVSCTVQRQARFRPNMKSTSKTRFLT